MLSIWCFVGAFLLHQFLLSDGQSDFTGQVRWERKRRNEAKSKHMRESLFARILYHEGCWGCWRCWGCCGCWRCWGMTLRLETYQEEPEKRRGTQDSPHHHLLQLKFRCTRTCITCSWWWRGRFLFIDFLFLLHPHCTNCTSTKSFGVLFAKLIILMFCMSNITESSQEEMETKNRIFLLYPWQERCPQMAQIPLPGNREGKGQLLHELSWTSLRRSLVKLAILTFSWGKKWPSR